MNRLILLLVLGVMNVLPVAVAQEVAQKPANEQGTYRLASEDQRTGGNRQPVAGPSKRAKRYVSKPEFYTIIPADHRASAKDQVADSSKTQDVDDCPCGPDCKCPSEEICKSGDCQKNYIVMYSAKWCSQCPRMKRTLAKLEEQGYIVYYVDTDENPESAETYNVTKLPTTIIMDKGEEVTRFEGAVPAASVTEGVKKRDEQDDEPAPVDTDTDYDFTD